MSDRKSKLRLGAFLQANGNHAAAWRHLDAQPDIGVNFSHYKDMAQIAEAAKFDLIFLADGVAVRENTSSIELLKRSGLPVSFCGMQTAWFCVKSKWPRHIPPRPGAFIRTLKQVLPPVVDRRTHTRNASNSAAT